MYYKKFVKHTFGNISFADVMLGDSIKDASDKLSSYFNSDVEEKSDCIKPSIRGGIVPFDDRYMISVSISLYDNPINCIELNAHFESFPYNTFSDLESMELSILDENHPFMELVKEPQWLKKESGALFRKERKTQMHNLLCDYSSLVGLKSDGSTTIGIKIEIPKHNLNDESKSSVLATYESVNKLVRDYHQKLRTIEKIEEGGKNVMIL